MSNLSNSRSIQAEFKLWRKNSQACRALEISLAVVLFCSALPDIGGYGGQSGVQLDIIFQMSLIQRIFSSALSTFCMVIANMMLL